MSLKLTQNNYIYESNIKANQYQINTDDDFSFKASIDGVENYNYIEKMKEMMDEQKKYSNSFSKNTRTAIQKELYDKNGGVYFFNIDPNDEWGYDNLDLTTDLAYARNFATTQIQTRNAVQGLINSSNASYTEAKIDDVEYKPNLPYFFGSSNPLVFGSISPNTKKYNVYTKTESGYTEETATDVNHGYKNIKALKTSDVAILINTSTIEELNSVSFTNFLDNCRYVIKVPHGIAFTKENYENGLIEYIQRDDFIQNNLNKKTFGKIIRQNNISWLYNALTLYNNENDGNISQESQREKIGDYYDLDANSHGFNKKFLALRLHNDNVTYNYYNDESQGDFSTFVNIYDFITNIPSISSYNTFDYYIYDNNTTYKNKYTNTSWFNFENSFDDGNTYIFIKNTSYAEWDAQTKADIFNNNLVRDGNAVMFRLFDNDEQIEKFFKYFNIPCTTNIDNILNKNSGEWFTPIEPPTPEEFEPGRGGDDEAGTGGGTGELTDVSDEVETNPPLYNVLGSFVYAHAMNLGDVGKLRGSMAINNFSLTDVRTWITDPSEAIISLKRYPFNLDSVFSLKTKNKIKLLGQELKDGDVFVMGSEVDALNSNISFEMGNIKVQEAFGSFLDYSMVELLMYLPYVGFVTLNPVEVMDKTISLRYYIDFINGSFTCVAFLDGSIYRTFNGHIAVDIPLNTSNYRDMALNYIQNAVNVGMGAVTGAIGGGFEGFVEGGVSNANSAVNVTGMQGHVTTSVQPGGMVSDYLPNRPFLIYLRPQTNIPENYRKLNGLPTNIFRKLSELRGYTVCENVRLDGIAATEAEKEDIKNRLMGGIIL